TTTGWPTIFPTSDNVPPAFMFANGYDGGASSFNAAALEGVRGALYFPTEYYGPEFDFQEAFTIEMFFRTDGDQAGDEILALLRAGQPDFRYGLMVNEGGAGNVRFIISDEAQNRPVIDINQVSSRNYADGQWHYVQVAYDPTVDENGTLYLAVTSEDGSSFQTQRAISGDFTGFSAEPSGNMMIGRNMFVDDPSARNFPGLIDEVQITRGRVSDSQMLGRLGEFALPGDFNGDFLLDAQDIDQLSLAVNAGSADAAYDLNGDGGVDAADRDYWITQLRQTVLGDADLDGSFTTSDLVVVFQAGEYEDEIAGNSGWATGDWSGDQEFGTTDMVAAFQAGAFEAGGAAATTAAVPEPAGMWGMLLGAAGCRMLIPRRARRG
ncbi:MAG: hypothetical protein KDA45_15585, partial [Planctomycetales bacterium]|nr:hypothetical protein [Planctomycetales bacterium]